MTRVSWLIAALFSPSRASSLLHCEWRRSRQHSNPHCGKLGYLRGELRRWRNKAIKRNIYEQWIATNNAPQRNDTFGNRSTSFRNRPTIRIL